MNTIGGILFFYRRIASPLHATRATAGAAWALSLTAATLILFHPLVLLALLAAVLGAGAGAGVGRLLARSLRTALNFDPLLVEDVEKDTRLKGELSKEPEWLEIMTGFLGT